MAQELKSYSVVASSEAKNYLDGEINLAFEAYDADEVDAVLAEKDSEIADLKQKLAEKDEEIDKQKWRGDEWAKACNQKDKEIESLKASHYAESVDAGMRERRLKRALWLARLGIAKMRISWYKLWNGSISTMNPEDGARQDFDRWKNFEQECRAMVDKFK